MTDILGGERFTDIEILNKGWSEDRKYCVAMWVSVDKVKEMMASGEMLEYPYFEDMVARWK